MIDIKAIKTAAEAAEKHFYNERRQADFRRFTDRKTVIALCDEVERLRGELRRSESLIEQYREEAAHRENPDDYVMQY